MNPYWQKDGITIFCGKAEEITPFLVRCYGTVVLDSPCTPVNPIYWLENYVEDGGRVLMLGCKSYEMISAEGTFSVECEELAPTPAFGHAAVRPLHWMKSLLRFSRGAVLDPYMGSGTTLVAAKELRREAVGIERNENDCKVAIQRLEKC